MQGRRLPAGRGKMAAQAREEAGAQRVQAHDVGVVERTRSSDATAQALVGDHAGGSRASFIKLADYHKKIVEDSRRGIINPNSKFMIYWDIALLIIMIHIATWTPFEMGFLPDGVRKSKFVSLEVSIFLFVMNRTIDVFFLCDLCIHFFLSFFDKTRGLWITDRKIITQHYLRGWFTVDLISTIPWDLLNLGSSSGPLTRILLFTKLFRFLKLLRILRVSRIARRWETSFGVRYSAISLVRFLAATLLLAHWGGCLWGMTPLLEGDTTIQETLSPTTRYLTSVYWSTMTITTIGYGDVTAKTNFQRLIAIAGMCIGGSLYAYVVGAICGIVASMNLAGMDFRQTMDHLNLYLAETDAPQELRRNLRHYFIQCQARFKNTYYQDVLLWMSPGLQGRFSNQCHTKWLDEVGFVANSPPEEQDAFITAIVQRLQLESFPAEEPIISLGQRALKMYVVKKGLVARLGLVLKRFKTFGDDIILHRARRYYEVRTLTYVDVLSLEKRDLNHVLQEGDFPETIKAIKKSAARLSFRRAVLLIVQARKHRLQSRLQVVVQQAAAAANLSTDTGPATATKPRRESKAETITRLKHQDEREQRFAFIEAILAKRGGAVDDGGHEDDESWNSSWVVNQIAVCPKCAHSNGLVNSLRETKDHLATQRNDLLKRRRQLQALLNA